MNDPRLAIPSSKSSPTYFVADIAANHDGSLERAVELIRLAALSGANAAKFQNFRASTIVSKQGFKELGKKLTHQSKWKKEVYEVYEAAELPIEWSDTLVKTCEENGIDYFTAPYDLDLINYFSKKMKYFKVGSGDITWKQSLELIALQRKPILLATGASELWEVERAVKLLQEYNVEIILMQCNTNYTGAENNFDYVNLLVLNEYHRKFPDVILGLSDHSIGHTAVLGAVALGARVIEKHFTDDTDREGPDHSFSLNPSQWSKMVDDTRILERCLGDGHKKIEKNEVDAKIVQRRALRYKKFMKAGTEITEQDLIALRPCPDDGIDPFDVNKLIGKILNSDVTADQMVRENDFRIK